MSFAVRMIGWSKSGFVWRPTISSDVTNWVLYSQAIAAGWDGAVPLDAEVTVGSGIVLSANSTSYYGFDTGSGFPVGTTLKLIMPGYVCGMGGAGGNGASSSPTAGLSGGPALRAQHAIMIDATGGVIAGGGGGGGGAKRYLAGGGGGGGGRTGRTGSPAGANEGSVSPYAINGSFSTGGDGGRQIAGVGGTTGVGGDGGNGYSNGCGGGGGGGWGAAGGAGYIGAAGGAGGAAVVGNSYITWINTGTRYGAIT